jgi:predicted dinucleotide-binding enzyme
MRIGTIGAGFVARAVATVAARHGHEVMVSNSRGPETLFSLVGTLGCKAGSPKDAAQFGDIVLVAIPLKNYQSIPVEPLQGKIVLDANNYYPERMGTLPSSTEVRLRRADLWPATLPKSKIVKVFNAIQAAEIESDGRPAGDPDRRALPIAGDDTEAKKLVADLLDQFGFDVVDAGPLVEGKRFQKDTPGYCVRLNREKLINALALA